MATLDQLGTGSSLTIEETTPAGAGWQPRKIILVGPALPFMGAEWGFKNNLHTTWYQGNPEGSQQNMGPQELPSAWEGEWNRTRMARDPSTYVDEAGEQSQIVSPHVLRELMEDIGRSGQRLRVTWAVHGQFATVRKLGTTGLVFDGDVRELDVRIVREGRMGEMRTPIDRATDMRWNVSFEWVGRGPSGPRVTNARPDDQDATKAADAMTASLNQVKDLINARVLSNQKTVRKSASVLTLGQLEALAGAPLAITNSLSRSVQRQVSNLKRVGDIALKLRSQPFAVAGSVLDLAANTQAIANKFVDELSRQPAEQRALKAKVATVMRANNYFNRVALGAQDCAQSAQELDARFRRTLASSANRGALTGVDARQHRAGDILAVCICKAGDTPSKVATRYYGNADHAIDILRGNRLPWYTPTFRPGQIVIIFALSTILARSRA